MSPWFETPSVPVLQSVVGVRPGQIPKRVLTVELALCTLT